VEEDDINSLEGEKVRTETEEDSEDLEGSSEHGLKKQAKRLNPSVLFSIEVLKINTQNFKIRIFVTLILIIPISRIKIPVANKLQIIGRPFIKNRRWSVIHYIIVLSLQSQWRS